MRGWLGRIGVKTLYIEPGSPWENGYCESLNSKLRDELLNGEIFTTLREAQVLIENWRRHYNAVRPHSSLRYRPPAPEAILPPASGLPYAPLRPAQTLADRRPGSNLVPGIVMRGRPLSHSVAGQTSVWAWPNVRMRAETRAALSVREIPSYGRVNYQKKL